MKGPDYQMKSHAPGTNSFSNSDRQQPQVSKANLQKGSDSLENQTKIKKKSGRNNTMHRVVDNF